MRVARWATLISLCGCVPVAGATELVLRLNGAGAVVARSVRYRCDLNGTKLGLPPGEFRVRYVNGAGNSLAVVRVGGVDTVFANVVSADGARYAAGRYVWWSARETSFAVDGSGERAVALR